MYNWRLNILWLAITCAIASGWYVDRNTNGGFDLAGEWFSKGGHIGFDQSDFTSALTIRQDGTFSKTVLKQGNGASYEGVYHREDDGLVSFHIDERIRIWDGEDSERDDVRLHYQCRCGMDDTGVLVINLVNDYSDSPVSISWNRAFSRVR